MDAPETPQPAQKQESGIGAMAAIVVVVILMAVGGAYFLYQEYQRVHTPPVEEVINA